MQLKVLAIATMLGLGAASSFAVDTVVTLSGGSSSSGIFGATRTGAFSDNFTFTTGALPSFVSSSVTSIALSTRQDVTFTNVSLRTGPSFATTVALYFPMRSGYIELHTLESGSMPGMPILLANTTYAVHIEGTAVDGTGSYAGTLNVAFVPEPGTYALMMAGLGIVGFAARHRSFA